MGKSPHGNNEVPNPLWRLRSGATPVVQGITSLRKNKASLAGNKVRITTAKSKQEGWGEETPGASASHHLPHPPHRAQGQDGQGIGQSVLREGRRMRHT